MTTFVQYLFSIALVVAGVVLMYMFACAIAEKRVPVRAVYLLVICLVVVMVTVFVFPTTLLAGLI
jgi:hypothetical protein